VTRSWAAGASGLLADEKAVPGLRMLLLDRDTSVRRSAAAALSQIGAPEAVPDIARLARRDRDAKVAYDALLALGRLGGPAAQQAAADVASAWTPYTFDVEQPADFLYVGACRALGDMKAAPPEDVLPKLLENRNAMLAVAAAYACARSGRTEAVRVILDRMSPVSYSEPGPVNRWSPADVQAAALALLLRLGAEAKLSAPIGSFRHEGTLAAAASALSKACKAQMLGDGGVVMDGDAIRLLPRDAVLARWRR